MQGEFEKWLFPKWVEDVEAEYSNYISGRVSFSKNAWP